MTCIKPFHEFAYLPDETPRPISEILPGSPWQVEVALPGSENISSYPFFSRELQLARTRNNKEEIWLVNRVSAGRSFVIYYPESQTWAKVSALIKDKNLFAGDLFVTSDGTLWGKINVGQVQSVPMTVPVLSRFNETKQRFEVAAGGLEIPITVDQGLVSPRLEIVLDKQDVFWIFNPDDGIYRYDPETKITEQYADLANRGMYSLSTALAPDGSIYFRDYYYSEAEEFLFQFLPETGEIIALDIPRDPWGFSGGMLVDHKGRLHLGAMGYMETDGSLHLLHRSALRAWENRSEFLYWSPPTLQFESSDERLWYLEYHDMERIGEGTAWYDPETGKGCLFTNLASYIVEDANKQLWMVVNGKLYRYPLEQ